MSHLSEVFGACIRFDYCLIKMRVFGSNGEAKDGWWYRLDEHMTFERGAHVIIPGAPVRSKAAALKPLQEDDFCHLVRQPADPYWISTYTQFGVERIVEWWST
jgi:hypothetical protein